MTPEEIRKQMMGSAGVTNNDANQIINRINDESQKIFNAKNLKLRISSKDVLEPTPEDIEHAVQPEFCIYSKINGNPILESRKDENGNWEIENYLEDEGCSIYSKNLPKGKIKKIFTRYLYGDLQWNEGIKWIRDAKREQEYQAHLIEGERLQAALREEKIQKTSNESSKKNYWIAIALAVVFGPFGLFYISWKRALVVLAIWVVAVALFHNPILFWILLSAGSVILMGTGSGKDA